MPSLGSGLSLGTLNNGTSFDADALAYAVLAGVPEGTERFRINEFVKGVKSLGLWGNMVSWPLRSTQNAGTTTTAYSLGGWLTKNGTLTNGPTWGANGIAFDGTNDYITIPFTEKSGSTTHNFGVIASMPTPAVSRIALQAGGPWVGMLSSTLVPTASEDGNRFQAPSYTANTYFSIVYDKVVGSFSGYLNGALMGSMAGSVTLSATPLLIGAYQTSSLLWLGNIAFAHIFNVSLTPTQNANFYAIYKASLGAGLGLP